MQRKKFIKSLVSEEDVSTTYAVQEFSLSDARDLIQNKPVRIAPIMNPLLVAQLKEKAKKKIRIEKFPMLK